MNKDAILDAIKANTELTTLADSGNAAAIVTALNAKTIENRDRTLYGPVLLRKKLPAEVVEGALLSFEAAASGPHGTATMRAFLDVFKSTGFDFSDEMTIANINALVAGGMPEPLGAALKSVGVWYTSIAGEEDVTLQQVQEALASRATAAVYQAVADRYNATIAALDAGEVTTLQQAKAFFAGA